MRVFNLTDVATPVLEQHGLVNQHIAVARRMVNPGEYADVGDVPNLLHDLQFLLQVGAVTVDRVPPAYSQARQLALHTNPSRLDGVPVRQVAIQETRPAGITPNVQVQAGSSVVVPKYDPMQQVADAVQPVPDSDIEPAPETVASAPTQPPVATSKRKKKGR